MSSSGRMHVSRPKSSKGRCRPMMASTSNVDPPSQSSSLSPQPPATKANDRSNQCLQSQAILRPCNQPCTEILSEIFDRPPDEPVLLNKYKVLPSIEKKTGTDRTSGQGDNSHRICQQHTSRVHTKVRPDVTLGSETGRTPPEEPGLLLAIRTPCGQRFKCHFRPGDQLQVVLSAAEAEFGESSPLNADALVLVSLCGDHHIGLVQNKHFDLFGVDELQLNAPVQNRPSICQFDFWIKFAHLLNDFPRLQSQLICGRNAQTLQDRHRLDTKVLTTFTL
uniref:Uncharacterized protein n=1 Tax=Cyprinus carpio TaxID=7962 RepID=A0A8C2CZZ6_CYPCA